MTYYKSRGKKSVLKKEASVSIAADRFQGCPLDLATWKMEVAGDQDKWKDQCWLGTGAFHPMV